jgi:hypothetical protein
METKDEDGEREVERQMNQVQVGKLHEAEDTKPIDFGGQFARINKSR